MVELVPKDNPVLRKKTEQVKDFDSVDFLVDELFNKLETLEGVGLAAPQIGKSLSVAVLKYTRKKDDKADISDIPETILINPKIIWRSKERELQTEACFSLPKQEFEVLRHKKIHIEYNARSGKREKLKAKGLFARTIQHEIDHLDGILICDK
ncbi:MAG: peptide deformylase [bacterium]